MSSVDEQVFVDGAEHPEFAVTYTRPPYASFPRSGHWPSTLTCPPSGAPCNVVGSPTILPGENTVALYVGWVRGTGEPVPMSSSPRSTSINDGAEVLAQVRRNSRR